MNRTVLTAFRLIKFALVECLLHESSQTMDRLAATRVFVTVVEQGSLTLHGWYFDIDSGELVAYDAPSHAFSPLI